MTSRPVILIVDDSEEIREVFRTFLELEGFTVLCAGDGARGLSLAREHRPGAIVMDAMLPGVSGWDALQQMRADPELCGIPTLIVTGDGRPGAKQRAAEGGAAGFLRKPCELDELMRAIRRALAN
jgi:CheY-like chemotaxis protein